MSNNTHKSAAVPFVNQKGERSMKRVKVERYVAGKKPSYAKDEDDEYYTTDEEISGEEEEYDDDQDMDDEQGNLQTRYDHQDVKIKREPTPTQDPSEDEEDDDPRFRKLKQLDDSKKDTKRLLEAQTSSSTTHVYQSLEEKLAMADEADEEEHEVRQRHALAKARTIEEPLGAQVILGDFADLKYDEKNRFEDDTTSRVKTIQTEDILADFKLTKESRSKKIKEEKAKMEQSIKKVLEEAKEEAELKAQVYKKIEEDKKLELEKDMLKKGGIGVKQLELVNTDDEDDEIAYEEWKLREIQRVARDRAERMLWAKTR